MVMVDGKPVACDTEVITVVQSGRLGETVATKATTTGRRVHAELCDSYQEAEKRERTRRELAAYNRRPPKGRSL